MPVVSWFLGGTCRNGRLFDFVNGKYGLAINFDVAKARCERKSLKAAPFPLRVKRGSRNAQP